MSNLVAFIPSRGNSKRVPRKNIRDLCGKPLLAYTIEAAKKCDVSRVIVNTEDEEIAHVAKEYGAEVQMRNPGLSQDNTSTAELLRSEIPKLDPVPDAVLLLQPTVPFRNSNIVNIAISYFQENLEKYDSLISVERVPSKYSPYAMIVEHQGKKMLFRKLIGFREKISSWVTGKTYAGPKLAGYPIDQRIQRRQDFPECWLPTGSVYIFLVKNLKKDMYGEVLLLEGEPMLNINEESDFLEAERLCTQS